MRLRARSAACVEDYARGSRERTFLRAPGSADDRAARRTASVAHDDSEWRDGKEERQTEHSAARAERPKNVLAQRQTRARGTREQLRNDEERDEPQTARDERARVR